MTYAPQKQINKEALNHDKENIPSYKIILCLLAKSVLND